MGLIPVTADATASVISTMDPAICLESSQLATAKELERLGMPEGTSLPAYILERYRRPSSWRESVKFKDGQRPTVFVIGVVPPSELNRIDDECSGDERRRERHWRTFLAGIRDIENGPTAGGAPPPKKKINGIEYVDPAWLASTFVRSLRAVAVEIGSVVYAWNQLQDDDLKN